MQSCLEKDHVGLPRHTGTRSGWLPDWCSMLEKELAVLKRWEVFSEEVSIIRGESVDTCRCWGISWWSWSSLWLFSIWMCFLKGIRTGIWMIHERIWFLIAKSCSLICSNWKLWTYAKRPTTTWHGKTQGLSWNADWTPQYGRKDHTNQAAKVHSL